MRETKSLTIIISELSAGGAQRVVSILANYWANKGWDVTILCFDDGGKPPFYPLDPKVTCLPLNIAQKSVSLIDAISNNINRILVLRKALRKNPSQPVISFISETNILALFAGMGLGRPIIVSERVDPNFSCRNQWWKTLRNRTYPLASKVVLQMNSSISCFSSKIQRKITVIPNPVIKPDLDEEYPRNHSEKKVLLAMGRLAEQKGFDLLLRAFAEVSPKFSDWTLHIWGEGSLKKSLEQMRDQLNLHDKVQLPGLTTKPNEIMRMADIFVMSSRYEGFPNVLVEAMVCGLPVISFACHGPKDLIRDGVDGVLIPPEDVPALASGLEKLMNDEEKRRQLSVRSTEVLERFGLEKVTAKWESLLSEIAP